MNLGLACFLHPMVSSSLSHFIRSSCLLSYTLPGICPVVPAVFTSGWWTVSLRFAMETSYPTGYMEGAVLIYTCTAMLRNWCCLSPWHVQDYHLEFCPCVSQALCHCGSVQILHSWQNSPRFLFGDFLLQAPGVSVGCLQVLWVPRFVRTTA